MCSHAHTHTHTHSHTLHAHSHTHTPAQEVPNLVRSTSEGDDLLEKIEERDKLEEVADGPRPRSFTDPTGMYMRTHDALHTYVGTHKYSYCMWLQCDLLGLHVMYVKAEEVVEDAIA